MSENMRGVFALGVAGMLVGLLAAHGIAQAPASAQVTEVRVEGVEQAEAAGILGMLRTRPGENYDESTVRSDEKRLLKTGRFDSVHATRTHTPEGLVVTFVVVARPIVSALSFKGNNAFKDTELARELTFRVSDPLNRFSIETGREALLKKYRSGGYHFATVELDASALADKREVIYRIVEGPKVVVSKIRFKGNKHFGTLKLRGLVGSSARIWPIVAGYLDMEQLDSDVQRLRSEYLSAGFLDSQVGRSIEFSPDKKKATVTFVIEEGPRFRVNKVIFEGSTVFSDAELTRRLVLQRGEFFIGSNLQLDTRSLNEAYGELGYIDTQIVSRKQFLPPSAPVPPWAVHLDEGRPSLLNLIFRIEEADQYRIGRIDVRGNTVTQDRIIRRELRFFPGQLLNMTAVTESRRRLMETRLFERVDLTPVGTAAKERNLLVQVAETETANFMIGASVSTNTGLLGNVSLVERNFDILGWPRSWSQFIRGKAFKGAGQTLRIVAEPGIDLMRYHIEWFEPYLFDRPYSLGTKAMFFTRERENYDETRYGGVVSVGHRFKNRWYGEVSSRIEGIRLDNLDSDAPPEVTSDAGTHALIGMKGTLVRDRTDSRWMASTGDRFRLSYEQITGGFNFGRALGDYRIYRTLHVDRLDRKHILAARTMVASILGDAPVFERYYGGGIGSVRGFEYRGISPRSKGTDKPIGGEFMVFAGVEYGFPIVGEQLRGVVFLDTGTVENTCEITTYRAAAGVGLRWIIPMFGPLPMSLDFGFPLNKDDDDETQLLSFTFGWTF